MGRISAFLLLAANGPRESGTGCVLQSRVLSVVRGLLQTSPTERSSQRAQPGEATRCPCSVLQQMEPLVGGEKVTAELRTEKWAQQRPSWHVKADGRPPFFQDGNGGGPLHQALCRHSFEPGEGWLRLKSQEWAEPGAMKCLCIAEESRHLCYLGVQSISHRC